MSAAIVRVSVALGACAAFVNLLTWRQPIMQMANGHSSAFKALFAMWFVCVWGVATGSLTGLVVSSMRRRSAGPVSAAAALVIGLFVTSAVCLLVYRFFTDMRFMHAATGRWGPEDINPYSAMPGMDMARGQAQRAQFNAVGAFTSSFTAVALSVTYAFGGRRRELR
jgi:hypothetical protein